MTRPACVVLRTVAVVTSVSAILLCGGAIASADPATPCTAADLARISAGVSSATADYLTANPDVNTFFTSLKGQDTETLRVNVDNYLSSNPTIRADLEGIRAPLAAFETQCL